MSLADRLADRELSTLVLDIERLPGLAWAWHPRTDYIPPDNWEQWPRTILVCAGWLGETKVHAFSEWEHGRQGMHEAIFDMLDRADLTATFNGVAFDLPHLQDGFTEHGLGKPQPSKPVDLLKVARQSHGWESNTLDQVCQRLGIESKNDKYDRRTALAAVNGDEKAQRRITRYCRGDVKATRGVYLELLPHVKAHPHVAPARAEDANLCPRCGSDDVERRGTYSPAVYRYRQYHCKSCGGWYRTSYESKGPSTRAL